MNDMEIHQGDLRASLEVKADRETEKRYPGPDAKVEHTTIAMQHSRTSSESFRPDDDPQFITGFKLFSVMFAVTLVCYLVTLDSSIIATAIPRITSRFDSVGDVGWYGSAYLIANSACQLSTGKLYQYYRTKWIFMIFLAIFELGSLLCAVASSSKMLCVARGIAGLGASGLVNGSLTIIAASSPPEKRPALTGIAMAISLLGIVCGPLLGGVITQHASWRWCFYINLPVGAVSAVIALLVRTPDASKKGDHRPTLKESLYRLDPVGFILFGPSCIMLLLALQWGGQTYRWSSSTIIGLFVGSGVTFIIFLFWERRLGDADAMMPISMITKPVIFSSCLVACCNLGGMQLMAYYLTIWFQAVKGVSPSMAGVYQMGTILPQVLGTLSGGILISKIGYPSAFAMFGSACAAIGTGLLTTLLPSTALGKFIGYQVVMGIGRGMVVQQPITCVQNAVPLSQMPVSTALVVFSQYFGGAIFIALGQTAFINSLGPKLAQYAPSVSESVILRIGATNLRNGELPADDIPGIIMAYDKALTITFYLSIGAACAAFFASMGMGWKHIPRKNTTKGKSDTA